MMQMGRGGPMMQGHPQMHPQMAHMGMAPQQQMPGGRQGWPGVAQGGGGAQMAPPGMVPMGMAQQQQVPQQQFMIPGLGVVNTQLLQALGIPTNLPPPMLHQAVIQQLAARGMLPQQQQGPR